MIPADRWATSRAMARSDLAISSHLPFISTMMTSGRRAREQAKPSSKSHTEPITSTEGTASNRRVSALQTAGCSSMISTRIFFIRVSLSKANRWRRPGNANQVPVRHGPHFVRICVQCTLPPPFCHSNKCHQTAVKVVIGERPPFWDEDHPVSVTWGRGALRPFQLHYGQEAQQS